MAALRKLQRFPWRRQVQKAAESHAAATCRRSGKKVMNIGARFGGNRIEPATLPHGGCVGSRAASCAYKHLFSAAAVRCCAAISPDHCSGCLHIIWLNYVQLQGVCARSVSEEFWRLRRISLPMTSPPSLISRLSCHCQLSVMQSPVPISVCDSSGFMMHHCYTPVLGIFSGKRGGCPCTGRPRPRHR